MADRGPEKRAGENESARDCNKEHCRRSKKQERKEACDESAEHPARTTVKAGRKSHGRGEEA